MSKWVEIFLAVIYPQNMGPHKILGFSDNYFYYYIFLCRVRRNMVNYRLKTLEFCVDLHRDLSPRPQEIICQSLAPFRIFTGVDSVQRIINRWIRAEIQLKCKKHQTSSEKSRTWWWLHTGHLQSWEKVWDQSGTRKHMDLRIPENLGV